LALRLEVEAITRLDQGIPLWVDAGRQSERELSSEILGGEGKHADRLEAQLDLVRQIAEQRYRSQQIHDQERRHRASGYGGMPANQTGSDRSSERMHN
jgi:bacterioferritin (cytochrome b1)